MAKKDKGTGKTLIIAAAIIIAAFIIVPKLNIDFIISGDKLFSGLNQREVLNIINNPPTDGQCTLSITPNSVCAGDIITGRLTDGANTNCYVFVTDGTDWTRLDGRTDGSGVWTHTDRILAIGNFKAIGFCDKDNSGTYTEADCFTNIADLTVRNCGDFPDTTPPTTYTCGQGADQNTCGGTCPVGYGCYDISSSSYRWCACATGAPMEGGTGEIHPDWKPDGQYFNPVTEGYSQQTCTDSDGGKDYFTKGQVTGYMEGGYFIDGSWDACTSSTRLSEYFCYQKDGVWYATWETYNCENLGMTWGCYNGVCMEVL